MRGFGVDINAPRPPFVLFKVILRAFATNSLLTPFYLFLRVLFKLFGGLAGYLVGFVFGDGEGDGGGGKQQPVSRDARIPRPDWGPDLSFMDDEYL